MCTCSGGGGQLCAVAVAVVVVVVVAAAATSTAAAVVRPCQAHRTGLCNDGVEEGGRVSRGGVRVVVTVRVELSWYPYVFPDDNQPISGSSNQQTDKLPAHTPNPQHRYYDVIVVDTAVAAQRTLAHARTFRGRGVAFGSFALNDDDAHPPAHHCLRGKNDSECERCDL